MKKATVKTRHWHAIHARKLHRRSRNSVVRRRNGHRRSRRPLSGVRARRPESKHIVCPPDFSLETNFDGVAATLSAIRSESEHPERGIYIDFREIRKLSASAALALAAELDRFNHVRGRLRAVDVREWDPGVRNRLADMGFFDLLRVRNRLGRSTVKRHEGERRYVKFRTGTQADGKAIEQLRAKDLEPVVGAVPGKTRLYAAVTEAMTNVVHHAYTDDSLCPYWWLSASYSSVDSEVAILIFDQGSGIPHTLPKRFGEQLRGLLPSAMNHHAELIRAAHDLERTASGHENRGFGLERDIRGYLDHLDCEVRYRVASLRGEYICVKSADGQKDYDLREHGRSLQGTLIDWRLKLG